MFKLFKSAHHKLQKGLLEMLAQVAWRMPHNKRKKLAGALGTLSFDLLKIRRNHVISSLKEHLGLPQAEAALLAKKVYYHFMLNALEMASLKCMTREELSAKVKAEGLHHLDNALAKGCGAIIVSGHFGLWELVPPWLALKGYKVNVVVRRQNNQYVDAWMNEMRTIHGADTTDSGYGMRKILRSIKRGEILALMTDQDNGKQGVFVDFFDKPASAPTGPATISFKTGAPIVPLFIYPDYQGTHHLKIYEPMFPHDYSADMPGQQQITFAYTKILEAEIRRFPHQWFWLHRRWKTSVKDAPDSAWAKLYNSLLTKHENKG